MLRLSILIIHGLFINFFCKNQWTLFQCLYCWFPEAFTQRCSVKKDALKFFWQNSQASICNRVSFLIKLQAKACNLIKKETLVQVFSFEFCEIFNNTFFLLNTSAGFSWVFNRVCPQGLPSLSDNPASKMPSQEQGDLKLK